ncbi:ATP-binding cassette subfamily C member 4 [Leptinotarsa decemlineata]|uniref:ATP-binding cassette subfamily C member 4 n=1 Tax=Leptinotarsa decemlineata TaxID=7539 RepID=UPI003D30824F
MDHSEKIQRKAHPRERANIFSLLTFIYTRKIFTSGFKKDLEDDDLYDIIRNCKSRKCADKLEHSLKHETRRSKPSTYRALWNCYGIKYICLGIISLLMHLVGDYLEPEAISKLVGYFKPGQTTMTLYDALFYAGIMLGLKLLHAFYRNNYSIFMSQLALQIRTAFSSIIYRKVLKLSPKALENTSLGNIVTVITKDVNQFQGAIWLLNDLWIAIVQTFFICYLIYNRIGITSLAGVLMLLSLLPIQTYVASVMKRMRLKMNKRTDERLQKTQETLSTIRTIKMYTWEIIFGSSIEDSRKKETKTILKTSLIKSCLWSLNHFMGNISFYALIMIYIWVNEDMSVETVFYLMRNFGALRHTIGGAFSMGFTRIAEVMACLNRIDRVLQLEELEDDQVDKPDDDPLIDIRNVSLKLRDRDILKNITAKMGVGLNVLTGQLGCGKSSLMKVILKDYPIDEGELRTRGRKSYASQDPWLFPSTIRQNILFGEKYDYKRYRKVVEVCALEYDFKILESGDDTIVADRGLNLSKGQQARINLARAVYKDSDIYLIDDALTALDPQVQDQIYNQCIKGFLKDKLVLLVTHNAKHIAGADMLLILQDGEVKFAGKQIDISEDILKEFEEEEFEMEVSNETKDEENVLVKDEDGDEESQPLVAVEKNRKQIYHEVKKEGKVDLSIYAKYVKFGGGWLFLGFIVLAYCVSTFTDSSSQKMLSQWTNQRAVIINIKETYFRNETIPQVNVTELFGNNFEKLNHTKELISSSTKLSKLLEQVSDLGLNKTLMVALHLEKLEWQASKTLNIYSLLLITSSFLEIFKVVLMMKFAFDASVRIHRAMIKSVIHSKMAFFDNYFIGNILNRFSQDLSVVDEQLPHHLSALIWVGFSLFGNVGLIASVSFSFILPTIVLVISLVLLRFIYMPSARSLKRLEAATRSPLVGHLNSTIEGLTTIRAYKAQEILRYEYDQHQDLFSSASYTSICVRGAFSFYMEIIALGFEIFLLSKFLFFGAGSAAGDVGLTLTQGGMLARLVQGGLRQWSEAENQMTSVERSLEYTTIEPETEEGTKVPNWPTHGEITYNNVSLTYTKAHEKVLKDITFKVKSKEKIGIVGRTGAGKSSIVSTLFRLYNFEGQIFIDGVETKTLPLKFLRQHISIIPQDPIMFSGTIRSNVDPLHEYTDEEIWKTLHKVKLHVLVSSLETHVEDTNFSTGQRQLICLARAIIRKNKIVVLDEATANMDPETESIIQKTVKENFSSCTVFVIAHRLESVLDCDKVMVLDRGQIAEYDDPQVLKEKPNGMFAEMLRNAGIIDSIKK